MTMQFDQISSLSLNTKDTNNNAIYYIASVGEKLQQVVLLFILRNWKIRVLFFYDRFTIVQSIKNFNLNYYYFTYVKMRL